MPGGSRAITRERRVWGFALIGGGAALAAAALAGNVVASSPTFGWKQQVALMAGLVAMGAGAVTLRPSLLLVTRTRERPFREAALEWARRHGLAIAALTIVAFVAFEGITSERPYDDDNMLMLTRGASSLWDVWTEPIAPTTPSFRPLAYTTVWLQYQAAGVSGASYFVVNILIWAAAAAAVYWLVLTLVGSRALAFGTALILVVDGRINTSIELIGARTLPFAALLGTLALIVLLRDPDGERWPRSGIALFLLLLAAGLSKEFGLAFAAAAATIVLLRRPRHMAGFLAVCAGALVAYGLLRLATVGTSAPYCEHMGFFNEIKTVCLDESDDPGTVLEGRALREQMGWNGFAGLLGSFAPFLFTEVGSWTSYQEFDARYSIPHVVFSGVVVVLALTAWFRNPRQSLPFLALLVANALFSVAVYRPRDQIIGALALYVSAAIGLREWLQLIRPVRWVQAAMGLAAVTVAIWALAQIGHRREDMDSYIEFVHVTYQDPCPSLRQRERYGISDEIVRKVRVYYDLPENCLPKPDR